MIDRRVEHVIRALGRETQVPMDIVETVVRRALPSIRLVPQFPSEMEAPAVGGCRIGGAPDLPRGVEWPRISTTPLSFLLQVDLAEVTFADREQILPNSGMFYFFFQEDEVDIKDVGILLFTQSTELQPATVPADLPAHQLYRGFHLLPKLEWTVPLPGDLGLTDHLELWDELEERVAAAQGYESPRIYGRGYAIHRLLGHGQFIQADGIGKAERLLLQVSSDAGLSSQSYPESGIGARWHDAGRIFFGISKEALKHGRFAEAFVTVECA